MPETCISLLAAPRERQWINFSLHTEFPLPGHAAGHFLWVLVAVHADLKNLPKTCLFACAHLAQLHTWQQAIKLQEIAALNQHL